MIVVLAMMLIACTSSQHRAGLDSADSLMNARPDSALTLLNALLPDTDQMRKGDLMRFHLLRTTCCAPTLRTSATPCSPPATPP